MKKNNTTAYPELLLDFKCKELFLDKQNKINHQLEKNSRE